MVLERGHVPELEDAHDAIARLDGPRRPARVLDYKALLPFMNTTLFESLGSTNFSSSNDSVKNGLMPV